MTHDGRVRGHWQRLIADLRALGPDERRQREHATARLLRESGIAFNVHAEPDDNPHACLDTLPLIMAPADWDQITKGLIQRAQLLERVLADLYSDASLLRNGLLPAAVVLGSQDFLRPCVRRQSTDRPALITYAVDVARAADGSWLVLDDHTEAPSGTGEAVAGRVAFSHGFAELFRDQPIQRLAGFFQTQRDGLFGALNRDDGRIVLLTRGPADPDYFSNAYIARYLGYSLVEGGDLTVRDDQVFLKTLDGLQRVDVLIRRLPGIDCDPLELEGQGRFGVAGLTRAARQGRIIIANALGSGLAQNRGLTTFLPALCEHVLGEELLLKQVPSLWCGDDDGRAALTDGDDSLAALPASGAPEPVSIERRDLLQRLEQSGHRYVARAPVDLATTPAWGDHGPVPARFAIRLFVGRTEQGYQVMPGGLVRVAEGARTIGLPVGHGSKDCWVLSERAESNPISLLKTTMSTVHLRRTGRDLLSRSADNLFWLGRNSERADGTLRVLRAVLTRLVVDAVPSQSHAVLERLLDVLLRRGQAPDQELPKGIEAKLAALALSPDRPYGLRDTLGHLHRTASLARDQISEDAWRMLSDLQSEDGVLHLPKQLIDGPVLDSIDEALRLLTAFSGTDSENMTRNYAWRFLDMGRRLERASHAVDLLRGLLIEGEDLIADGTLPLLLELADSAMTYRSRYLMTPLLAPVLDLLLLDETNPRAVAFQAHVLDEHLGSMPRADGPGYSHSQRILMPLVTELRLVDPGVLAGAEPSASRPLLTELLDRFALTLPELSDVICRSHFAHAEVAFKAIASARTGS
ncbi:MAG: circularly permuted type 2 ATP-grasp protein [Pseudomonadota bacterium]